MSVTRIFEIYDPQEKNVSQDAVIGKIGKIYVPDQKVSFASPFYLMMVIIGAEEEI